MAKMTIYLPDKLKARMDAVEGVNWSPLAARAFEAKLAEIITLKGAKEMDDVIARLKASKAKTDDASTIRGREAGREWAKDHAEAAELERLESYTEGDFGTGWTWSEWLNDPGPDSEAFGKDHYLAAAVSGDADNFDRADGENFWEFVGASDEETSSGAFLVGFVEGALEVWSKVKDEV
jgi:hypothetical protein